MLRRDVLGQIRDVQFHWGFGAVFDAVQAVGGAVQGAVQAVEQTPILGQVANAAANYFVPGSGAVLSAIGNSGSSQQVGNAVGNTIGNALGGSTGTNPYTGQPNVGGSTQGGQAGGGTSSVNINQQSGPQSWFSGGGLAANVGQGFGLQAIAGQSAGTTGSGSQVAGNVGGGALYDPMAAMRGSAQSQLSNLMANPSSVTQTPGYQFGMDQGTQALNRTMQAQGQGQSGAQQQALAQFGQGYAGQQYQQMYQNLYGLAGGGLGLSGVTGQNQLNWNAQQAGYQGLAQSMGGMTGPATGGTATGGTATGGGTQAGAGGMQYGTNSSGQPFPMSQSGGYVPGIGYGNAANTNASIGSGLPGYAFGTPTINSGGQPATGPGGYMSGWPSSNTAPVGGSSYANSYMPASGPNAQSVFNAGGSY